MILDDIPFELKEYIFTYFTPNDWINNAKVSNEWLELTLWSIKKVESCHLLIFDHLAEFINQRKTTNYTWVSLLTLMPLLEHLKCIEASEAFSKEISPVCNQLKFLELKPRRHEFLDLKKLDISFRNLTELLWDGYFVDQIFPANWFAFSHKLEKLTLKSVYMDAEWKKMIPKSVKHVSLFCVHLNEDDIPSLNFLGQDITALETFSAQQCCLSQSDAFRFFRETPQLKKLELDFVHFNETTAMMINNALRKYQGLEAVLASGVLITDHWQRLVPENIKSIDFFKMDVQENIPREFSFDWLFQNYSCLQSLQLRFGTFTGFDSQKCYSTESLEKLSLGHYMSNFERGRKKPIDIFSDICVHMIRGSHLVDVEICKLNIDESWKHIFPPTIKRIKVKDFRLSKEAQSLFSPQFICENPSNIEVLLLNGVSCDLPAMDLQAFTGMQKLQELNLNLLLSSECLQNILMHCSALTDIVLRDLQFGALTNIPHDLVLPSLRKLHVKQPVNQPFRLLQHFPKVRTVDIVIVPPEASFSAIMNALVVAVTVELKIRDLSSDHLCSLVESIDDTKFKYFRLSLVSVGDKEFKFFCTNLP